MGLVLVTLVLAVLVGWALGGRLSYLELLPYRSLPLLGGALVAMLGGTLLALAGLPARPTQGLGLAVAAGLTLAFCLRSRAVAGLGLVSAGLLLNALVIVVNGGMPVSVDASLRAGLDPVAAVADSRHLPAGGATTLRPLGDVIPAPLPVRPEVVSPGDLLGAAGMAQLVVTAMLLGRPLPTTGRRFGLSAPYRRRRTVPTSTPVPAPAAPPAAPGPAPVVAAPAVAAAVQRPGHVLVAERRGAMTVWRAAPAEVIGNGRLGDLDGEPAPRGGAT
jgi:hypothetical protein